MENKKKFNLPWAIKLASTNYKSRWKISTDWTVNVERKIIDIWANKIVIPQVDNFRCLGAFRWYWITRWDKYCKVCKNGYLLEFLIRLNYLSHWNSVLTIIQWMAMGFTNEYMIITKTSKKNTNDTNQN